MTTENKNKNRIIYFLQSFVVSKPFKGIFTDFLLKKQKLRNSIFWEAKVIFLTVSKCPKSPKLTNIVISVGIHCSLVACTSKCGWAIGYHHSTINLPLLLALSLKSAQVCPTVFTINKKYCRCPLIEDWLLKCCESTHNQALPPDSLQTWR